MISFALFSSTQKLAGRAPAFQFGHHMVYGQLASQTTASKILSENPCVSFA